MAQRGRPAGFKMDDSHRTKIANSQILKRLIEFAEGKEGITMSPHQVTAALGLMKKVMPDLETIRHEGEVTQNVISHTPKSAAEWAAEHADGD